MHGRVKKIDFLSTLNKIYGNFEKVMQFIEVCSKPKLAQPFPF